MLLKWTKKLSALPLCRPPESCGDDYMVNAAAISDDGSRVVGSTYYQNYLSTSRTRVDGKYGIYGFSTASPGTLLFKHEYNGDKGIYAVAISGDGAVAAGGGLLTKGKFNPFKPKHGVLLAFEAANGNKLLKTTDIPDRVNAVALSRNGHVLAAVAETRLYVFQRATSGLFSNPPDVIDLAGYCETVAVHPSGAWLAAADQKGTVYVIPIAGGVVGAPATWIAEEPEDPAHPLSFKVPVKFHSIAVSRVSDALAVGGGDVDSSGTRIVVADGYPNRTPGAFSLFNNLGVKLGTHVTVDMNWPIQVSANGSGIVGGSDDNTLLFFTP